MAVTKPSRSHLAGQVIMCFSLEILAKGWLRVIQARGGHCTAPDSDYSRHPCSLHTSPVTRSHTPLLAADAPSPLSTRGVPSPAPASPPPPRPAAFAATPPQIRKSARGNAANHNSEDDHDAPLCRLTSRTQPCRRKARYMI